MGASNLYIDETEGEAIHAEGHDPDDPAVVTAIDFVSWQLSLVGMSVIETLTT